MVSEQKLSDVLSDFAGTMVTDFAIQAILDKLVIRIVDMMPITSAGVTLIVPNSNPHYVAASDDLALRYEKLQTELDEGPCVAAYETGEAVSVPDLRDENAFPLFAKRALEAGLVAVFTFPLRAGDHQLGALDLYRDSPGPLDTQTMEAAQTLADVTSAYLLNAQARSDLRDSYDRVRESSLHDPLTGLPNRVLFGQRLDHAALRARRSGRRAAVLFVDLDRFKAVNDTFGHQVGDELLVAVADRLTGLLRPGDSLARMSGDEFVVLCEDLDDQSRVADLAKRIDEGLSMPFELPTNTIEMTASVGIAFAGRGNDIPERLLEDADAAMYQAKRQGGARHQVLDIREQRLVEHRNELERDLRSALDHDELIAYHQPIVSTLDCRIKSIEALLRWDHPKLGFVPPATIIPMAEQSGLIVEIGRWMLERACIDRHWFAEVSGYDDMEVSVNISPKQLMSSNFIEDVKAVLFITNTEPRFLTLEITESVFLQDSERALVILGDLKKLGVCLALDNFGSGYSSLVYLKQFPVDIVKVDQSYVSDLVLDTASLAIASAVVNLAHDLGVKVIAEGVETLEQYEQVLALECEYSQGYYFSRPKSASELLELLTSKLPVESLATT